MDGLKDQLIDRPSHRDAFLIDASKKIDGLTLVTSNHHKLLTLFYSRSQCQLHDGGESMKAFCAVNLLCVDQSVLHGYFVLGCTCLTFKFCS